MKTKRNNNKLSHHTTPHHTLITHLASRAHIGLRSYFIAAQLLQQLLFECDMAGSFSCSKTTLIHTIIEMCLFIRIFFCSSTSVNVSLAVKLFSNCVTSMIQNIEVCCFVFADELDTFLLLYYV